MQAELMPGNSLFRCKRFLIHQGRSAMKVTSDACIFGAWVVPAADGRLLDIGTGTGLLALMAAQRSAAVIEAVEIDAGAAADAAENFAASPWSRRLVVHHTSLQTFGAARVGLGAGYDSILCNPPFHDQAHKSKSPAKRLAWHCDSLRLEELVAISRALLNDTGRLFLLLTPEAGKRLETIAAGAGLFPIERCQLKSFAFKRPHRLMVTLGREAGTLQETELVIYHSPQVYTPECRELLAPYLLNL